MQNSFEGRAFDAVLFDLDGTIAESALGVTRSFSYALSKYGINEEPSDLSKVIGPPLDRSFMDFYGFSKEKADEAITHYREYYRARGIFECNIYDGIEDMLKTLSNGGVKILLATSKPTVFAVQILEHFGLSGYFSHAVGSELDGRRTNKAEVVEFALELADTPKDRVLMVGDRSFDVIGAHTMGVSAAGALWGYGSVNELSIADFTAKTPADICKIVIR